MKIVVHAFDRTEKHM